MPCRKQTKNAPRLLLSVSTLLAIHPAFGAPRAEDDLARPRAGAHGDVVSRFDAAVARGLPAQLSADGSASRGSADVDDLLIRGRLGGDVVFADGTRGSTYEATWHGEDAVATRSGDHLDITTVAAAGIEITGFTAGSGDVEHESLAGNGHAANARRAADTEQPEEPETSEELRPSRLTFHLMLHDDIKDIPSQHIHAGYVAWWLADFQRRIAPGKMVDILYSQSIPGVTDIRYGYLGALHDWSDTIGHYATEQDIPRTYRHKFLLLTKGTVEPGRYGRSWQKGSDGLASIDGRYPEIAHQIGHLLGARHGHAEVRYGGWWCETNMYAPSLVLRSNCYAYSMANMSLMNDYIRLGDGFVTDSRWSED